MQKVQLYIENERIDFFDDQKISVTQSIQDIKDPANIFTDFSKTFNIPASKINNKIFKHFYNFDIVGGFDARLKKKAEIKINFVSFKKGYIKLESVKLKDNAPESYNITFFGETVILKDTFGENKISSLDWLSNFTVDYSMPNVKSILQNPSTVFEYPNAIACPLITHEEKLFYNSTTGHAHDDVNTGNLYYEANSGTAHDHGVFWSDLKYSIKVDLIIKAITEKYSNVVFSNDFFNDTNLPYYNLYMWMHRKKGKVQSSLSGIELFQKQVTGFTQLTIQNYVYVSGSFVQVIGDATSFQGTISLNPVTSDFYNVYVKLNGETISTSLQRTGFAAINFNMQQKGSYTLILESSEEITFSTIDWQLSSDQFFETVSTTNQTIPVVFDFNPTQQLPDIKIIDFLKGIFKMFNLTAYVDNDLIVVDTLDNFYQNFNEYDITEYVQVDNSSVNSALPYKQIDFIYEDYKTYFSSVFNQLNNQQFGELKYNGENNDNFFGDIYKISLPFQKMLYEKISDINGNAPTTIQWGWMVDDNQEPYIGKPLFHYINRQISGTVISFRESETIHVGLNTYTIPLNSNGITGTGQSLNFKKQYDEYSLIENEETLFKNYYQNYISDVFSPKRRLNNITAYLPLRILLNYKLNDRFIVDGNVYKINSIKTDLQTGKSMMQLINKV